MQETYSQTNFEGVEFTLNPDFSFPRNNIQSIRFVRKKILKTFQLFLLFFSENVLFSENFQRVEIRL